MKTRLLLLTAFLAVATMAMGQSDFAKYLSAAQQGDDAAQCMTGYYYYSGNDGAPQDYAQAVFWYNRAAEQGYAEAQWRLGYCYYNGEGTTKDLQSAAYWFRKAADQGNAWGLYLIGICYYNGDGVKQNTEMATYWWRKAAELGNEEAKKQLAALGQPVNEQSSEQNDYQKYIAAAQQGDVNAQTKIGFCYAQGEGVAQDYAQAFNWWSKAAAQGNFVAQNGVGLSYQYGKGVAQDYAKAVYWYQQAANQGYADAQQNLGYCYKHGYGLTQDNAQATYWYRKAAEQGNVYAQYNLGNCYALGEGVPQDYAQAVYWLRKAADQGDEDAKTNLAKAEKLLQEQQPAEQGYYQKYITAAQQGDADAQALIGYCYHVGEGVNKDYAQAVAWYRKAASQGNALGQFNLGLCYANGEGVTQDYNQAIYWYRKGAEQGDASSQINLGIFYVNGQGVAQDYAQAAYWWSKAAEQGNAKAQCYLGYCYDQGMGVTQDLAQAISLYRKAADQGDETAAEWLVKAEERMREQQEQNSQKQNSLVTFDWIGFTPTVNKKEYQLKVGVKSDTKIEDVIVTVNGSLSRGINTVKTDGYDQTINRTLALREGENTIVVSIRNADGLSSSEKTITCHAGSSTSVTSHEKRVALVVGNSHYSKAENNLKNPENDATDIAKKLRELGFEVILKTDATLRTMEDELAHFREKAQNADVAMFYYAGHGVQSKGANYILPTDIQDIKEESDLKWKCVNMERVMDVMEDSHSKLKFVVLDACRNDPLSRSWHRSAGASGGLAQMNAPEGTILWYATSPGSVAQDGTGRNSPYTTAFLKMLDIPNLEVTDIYKKVGAEVKYNTGQMQTPWMSSNFFGDFYFNKQ